MLDTIPETSSVLKSPRSGYEGYGCYLPLHNNLENKNLDKGDITVQDSYPNQDQDAKPQSGTPSVF